MKTATIINALTTELHSATSSDTYITTHSIPLLKANGYQVTTRSKSNCISSVWVNLGPVQKDQRKHTLLIDSAVNDIDSVEQDDCMIVDLVIHPLRNIDDIVDSDINYMFSNIFKVANNLDFVDVLKQLDSSVLNSTFEVQINGEVWCWLNTAV